MQESAPKQRIASIKVIKHKANGETEVVEQRFDEFAQLTPDQFEALIKGAADGHHE